MARKMAKRKRQATPPLTATQAAMAESYLPFAKKLARRFGDAILLKRDWVDLESIHSSAQYGLVRAALKWRGFDGGPSLPFRKYAAMRIKGAMLDWHRKDCKYRFRISNDGDTMGERTIHRVRDWFPRIEGEAEEELSVHLRKLPRSHSEVMRRIYLLGESHREASKHLGICNSRVSFIHKESLAMLARTWDGKYRPGRKNPPKNTTGEAA